MYLGLFLAFAQPQTKHRVVIDMFSGGQQAYQSALGNVANLQKALGKEPLDVEIVCYGSGIDLVLANNNPLASKIKLLQQKGVRFAACNNTLIHRHIAKDRLFPFVKVVPAGIEEIVRKEEAGWSYLRR